MNTPINLEFNQKEALLTWNDRGRFIVQITPREFLTVAGQAIKNMGESLPESEKLTRKKTKSSGSGPAAI